MDNEKCGFDCAAECADRECRYLREFDAGRLVTVTCYGTCAGRCAGRFENEAPPGDLPAAPPHVRPDAGTRFPARSRELFFESVEEDDGAERYEVSCAVGCIVGHDAETTGGPEACYGSCLGICYGLAIVSEALAPAAREPRE